MEGNPVTGNTGRRSVPRPVAGFAFFLYLPTKQVTVSTVCVQVWLGVQIHPELLRSGARGLPGAGRCLSGSSAAGSSRTARRAHARLPAEGHWLLRCRLENPRRRARGGPLLKSVGGMA